jgi:hypothetical protein
MRAEVAVGILIETTIKPELIGNSTRMERESNRNDRIRIFKIYTVLELTEEEKHV